MNTWSKLLESFPPHILVVDDDARLRALLDQYLTEHGYLAHDAAHAEEAREALKYIAFDLIVLDVMMPGDTGFQLCQEMRAQGLATPILFLSAKTEVQDRIEGLELGGDDYLSKPFEPKELLLRIQSLLRRSQSAAPSVPSSDTKERVQFGQFTFYVAQEDLKKDRQRIALTEVERKLLRLLLENPNVPQSRESLATAISGDINPRSIDVQIVRLRRKVEEDPKFPRYLQTIRHQGYAFIPD
jgi:two-component system phosphate regulon response regulator OmpR